MDVESRVAFTIDVVGVGRRRRFVCDARNARVPPSIFYRLSMQHAR